MSEVKKIATRDSYGNALVELAQGGADNLVVLDADLAGATKTGIFKKAYPNRHFNCGIAECNMIGVAAGLSTMGLVPFASSFAMFAAGRAFEQIRNSVGYPHLNVKIGATHGGLSVGEDGGSHQAIEDIGLMRLIPGMTVVVPADANEARKAVFAAAEFQGPLYMRLGRLASPVFEGDYPFEIGKANVMREGTDAAVFACGLMVSETLEAAKLLEAEGIHIAVINVHTIKPIDADCVSHWARKCGNVVTVEEHSVIGGLGDAVADVLMGKVNCKFHKIGVNDRFGQSGKAADVLREYGLTADQIAETIKANIPADAAADYDCAKKNYDIEKDGTVTVVLQEKASAKPMKTVEIRYYNGTTEVGGTNLVYSLEVDEDAKKIDLSELELEKAGYKVMSGVESGIIKVEDGKFYAEVYVEEK